MKKKYYVFAAVLLASSLSCYSADVTADTYDKLITGIGTANNNVTITTDLVRTSGSFVNVANGVTIDGLDNTNGNHSIFSENDGGGFSIQNSINFTIKNIGTESNGGLNGYSNLGGSGSVLGNHGNLNIINSYITNNAANNGNIYNSGTTSILQSNLSENNATNGGAVYNTNKVTEITNTTFTANSASSLGGAIYNGGTISTISGTTFTTKDISGTTKGNTATYGGAIYNAKGKVITEITDTDFIGNNASNQGGAIFNEDRNAKIGSITGTADNYAKFTSNTASNGGGAIFNKGLIGSAESGGEPAKGIEYIEFKSNTSTHGGAIFSQGTIYLIKNSSFETNTATSGTGGAIDNTGNIISIDSTTFTSNTATTTGGAINNAGTIGTISNSNFDTKTLDDGTVQGNTAKYGGAIYNNYSKSINKIENSTFTGNTAAEQGGAIFNEGGNANATINLIKNTTFTSNIADEGGAIFNKGIIGNISGGSYNQNKASETTTDGTIIMHTGGAIYNQGTIGTIAAGDEPAKGIDNVSFSSNEGLHGGAIYNNNTIVQIKGSSFDLNKASNVSAGGATNIGTGGAIYNATNKTIGVIDDTSFTNNNADLNGGAIYNAGTITEITDTTSFTDNTTTTGNGGAIYNAGTINTLNGSYTNNNTTSSLAHGGAIYNAGTITNLDGSYESNKVTGLYSQGGAVYNNNLISTIKGEFKKNEATNGAAIMNASNGTINSINGAAFEENKASSSGAGIYNMSGATLKDIKATFTSNVSTNNGGAINNDGKIETIQGSIFNSNKANNGGAIFNENTSGTIDKIITSNFISNTATNGNGGAIINKGTITTIGEIVTSQTEPPTINVVFKDNTANNSYGGGGAIYNDSNSLISQVTNGVLFSENKVTAGNGGAIFNKGTINDIAAYFDSNEATTGAGGAIYNATNGNLSITSSNFINNKAITGGAIANSGNITLDISSNDIKFENNIATSGNGADLMLYSGSTVKITGTNEDKVIVFKSGNSTQSSISGSGNITNESAGTVYFNNNQKVDDYTGKYSQTNASSTTWLDKSSNMFKKYDIQKGNLIATNNSKITVDDSTNQTLSNGVNLIIGADDGVNPTTSKIATLELNNTGVISKGVNITKEEASTFDLKGGLLTIDSNDNINGALTNDGTVIRLSGLNNSYIQTHSMPITQNSGSLIFDDGSNFIYNSNETKINGGLIGVDNGSTLSFVDETANSINANGILLSNGSKMEFINNKIETLNISGDGENVGSNQITIDIAARTAQSDKIKISGDLIGNGNIKISGINLVDAPIDKEIHFTPIIDVDGSIDTNIQITSTNKTFKSYIGDYKFFSQGNGNGVLSLVNYNPQVFRGQVASLAMLNNQLLVEDILTNHMILQGEKDIENSKTANKYSSINPMFAPYQYSKKDGGLWYKSYFTTETLSMSRGLNVGNNAWGSIVGADLPMMDLKNDWKFIPTIYIAYNGAHQHYNGVSLSQEGGQGGFMGTFFKNSFIASILVYGGGYSNTAQVSGRTDTMGNWYAGTATKFAYNIKATRHFTIQPTLMAAYNAIGKQNYYTNFGNMNMNSGMLHGINIAPGMNLIYKRDTWSLYGSFSYMFNINDGISGRAGNVDLGDLEMRHGYIQYGVGATKTLKDRLNLYFQFNIRNAGRTGVGFQFGLNYLFDWAKLNKWSYLLHN